MTFINFIIRIHSVKGNQSMLSLTPGLQPGGFFDRENNQDPFKMLTNSKTTKKKKK